MAPTSHPFPAGLSCSLALFLAGCGSLASAATPLPVSAELSSRLSSTTQGAIVSTGDLNLPSLPELSISKTSGGPPYVFSDNPEYIRQPEGAALREPVDPGVFRLYTYHVNGTTGTVSKITTVLENTGTKPMSVRFLRRSNGGPSTNYYLVGKVGMKRFLEAQPEAQTALTIAPGEGAVLDPYKEKARVNFDELIHSFHDIQIDQPGRITVLQTPPDNDSVAVARRIEKVIPPKHFGAGRGKFPFSEYTVRVHGAGGMGTPFDTAQGPSQIIVADGKRDPWVEGVDSELATTVALKGNYGMIYDIEIPYTSTDGRSLAILVFNARTGSKWCDNMAAAMGVGEGKFPGGVVDVPTGRTFVTGLDQAVLLQVLPPASSQRTVRVRFTPPGASCLPVPILLVPFEDKVTK